MSHSAMRVIRTAYAFGVSPNVLCDPRHFARLVIEKHAVLALSLALTGLVF
jgi:hypothetical protein